MLSGCASIHQTFISKEYNDTTHGAYGYKSKVYAGVKMDVGVVGACCYMMACICAPVGLIDMPFSFVADTLFLPYTITSATLNDNKLKRCVDNKRKQGRDDDEWCKKDY